MTGATRIGELMGPGNTRVAEGMLEGTRRRAVEHAMVQAARARGSYTEVLSSGTRRPSRTLGGIVRRRGSRQLGQRVSWRDMSARRGRW